MARPSLDRVIAVVADAFGVDASTWRPGRRSDDQARAVAAYLARRSYGHKVTEIASALGYTSHGGVVAEVRRVENADRALRRMVARLERAIDSTQMCAKPRPTRPA